MNALSSAMTRQQIADTFSGLHIAGKLQHTYNIGMGGSCWIILQGSPEITEIKTWGIRRNTLGESPRMKSVFKSQMWTNYTTRIPVRQSRCIVLLDGFYHWKNRKKSYRVYRKEAEILLAAGICVDDEFAFVAERQFIGSDCEAIVPVSMEKDMAKYWLQEMPIVELVKMVDEHSSIIYDKYRIDNRVQMPGYDNKKLHDEIQYVPSLFG